MTNQPPITAKMLALVQEMEKAADQRAIFLNCYLLMTQNMLKAVDASEFNDSAWVGYLLERFAQYYFDGLTAYDEKRATTSAVWQLAHRTAGEPERYVLQHLLLGVNAHINYDLVLTLVDVLEPEWAGLTAVQQAERQVDYCQVNEIIRITIDTVQDDVVEAYSPVMDLVDKTLGPLDEWLISRLITNWRDEVWDTAVALMTTRETAVRQQLLHQIEATTLHRAEAILLKKWFFA